MKLQLRDYCDDVFDIPKQYWNKLIANLKLSDVHKMNTKQNFRIGGKQVTRRGGFPVLTYKNRVYVNAADCHSMIVATTRAGKSYSIISIMIDLLRMNGESMVINDPKGELRDTQVRKLINDGYDWYTCDREEYAVENKDRYVKTVKPDICTDTPLHTGMDDPV